ncbi:STAS/SEC14 domain-containing protein [Erythrobacter sp. JK5]|uniref:STAS/SEC14 domain-containing protein n=1 Tax=Erythrobacter sp. JK5 TaxID=2829500 RepID=UPI001BA8ED16|nr:STAS/SEC14 domain-containing protein [Erythrobacter sp. JK5]QUL37216.1 STAS/SEC14 domain-containing protein [Erythrobacter sp. JK5]
MIDIEQISPTAHRIVVMEEFHQADAEQLVDFAKKRNAAGGGGNLLFDATAVAGFTFSAVTVELAHIPTLVKWIYGLDRIAIVSDEEWIRTGSRIESALLPGVSYAVYDKDEAEAARAWIMEETEGPHTGAFHELDIGKPGIAAFELTGRLDRAESERGVAMVRARLEDPDCSKLLIVIRSWHGFDLDAMFSSEVVRGKLDLIGKLDRYAIVGGPDWIHGMVGPINLLLKPDIRAFDLDEQDEALAWLEETAAAKQDRPAMLSD